LLGDDIETEFVLKAPATGILIDPAELERSILNLIVNARHAMPRGGRVVIGTKAVEARQKGTRQTSSLALVVSDTGVGMDAETVAHCFEPFWTTKGRSQGTGLGLSTVHAAVTQAGGRISLDSKPGKGTTFILWFPVADIASRAEGEHAPSLSGPRGRVHGTNGQADADVDRAAVDHLATDGHPHPDNHHSAAHAFEQDGVLDENGIFRDGGLGGDEGEGGGHGEIVLVVEDEDELRRLASAELERRGYQVASAANAAEAFAADKELDGQLDLLVTDVMMPGMNGVEMADRMLESHPGLPVLLMSGHLDEGAVGMYLLRDDADLLEKPYSLDELARRVRVALDRAARPAATSYGSNR
jgi:two-component system cell cycle sensor histidine kinase/response regulator CckA